MHKPMTTDELIEELKKYPGMSVLVDGYERGFSDIVIGKEYVVPIANPHEWEGKYASFKKGGGPVANNFNAIVLKRDHWRDRP